MSSGKLDGIFKDYRTARKKRTDLFYLLVTWSVLLAIIGVGLFAIIDAVADHRMKARQDKIKSPEYAAWCVTANVRMVLSRLTTPWMKMVSTTSSLQALVTVVGSIRAIAIGAKASTMCVNSHVPGQ